MRRHSYVLAAVLVLAACHEAPTASNAARGPEFNVASAQGNSGSYIVRFRDTEPDVRGQTDRLIRDHAGQLTYRYEHALKGFAGVFADRDITAVAQDPRVLSIERDQVVHAVGGGTELNPPSWGLDRIDQHNLPLSNSYTYGATGSGVIAYIIDTGIRFTHQDFGGRASLGVDEVSPSTGGVDCNGHGTHVSGTVGGTTYGVAKSVTLKAVRVLGCTGSGSITGVIAGVDYVTGQKMSNPSTPMVANMSLGGGPSPSLDAAIVNSMNQGVVYAIAAGNDNLNACTESPSDVGPPALVMAASAINDSRASFSNFGTCVTMFGPGLNIKSDWNGSDTDTLTISGTSMATPHATGSAALYLELNPAATPAQVRSALTGNATPNVISNAGTGTPNLLLYMGFIGSSGPNPPVASFTSSCSGLTCNFDGSGSTAQSNATYTWNFGDGSAAGSGQTTSHTYASGGTFTVTLTVSDAGGTNSISHQVTAKVPAPVANWTFNCNGLVCTFDGSSSTAQPNATYTWKWGDETRPFGNTKVASHTYAAGGTYFVQLVVTDAGGTNTNAQNITISNAPPPPPVAAFTLSCNQLACSFDGSGSTAQSNATYSWNFGDGSAAGSGKTTTHSYASPGSFTVTLTVTDAGGTNSVAHTANPTLPAPVAAFTFSCNQLACSFDGSSSTAQSNATYTWDFGDSQSGTGTTTSHTYAAPGTYSVKLTVTDAGGTSSVTHSVVASLPAPVARFTFSCNQLACSFDGSTSTAQSNATYSWDFGDSQAGTGKTTTHSYAAPGSYAVTLTVTDAGGTSTVSHTVSTTLPAPVARFTFSCTGLGCSFDGSTSTAQSNATYTWNWGDGSPTGSGVTASHSYSAGGTFTVTLTVADGGGSSSVSHAVTVTVPAPVARFTFSCNGRVCTFDGSSSSAQPNATYTFKWGDETRPFGSTKVSTHTYANAGNYLVQLIVTDAGGTSQTQQTITIN